MRRCFPAALAAALLLSGSCGAPDDPPWLAVVDGDTIRASDAHDQWLVLSPEEQEFFLESGDPGGELIRSMAMKRIVEAVAVDAGYLSDPRMIAFRNSWLRTEASLARNAMILDSIIAALTPEDLELCAAHSSDTVRITLLPASAPGIDLGPFPLPHLPHGLAAALLETSRPGCVLPLGNGSELRVDDLVRGSGTVPRLDPSNPTDSTAVWTLAQGRLRFLNLVDLDLARIEQGMRIDTAAVVRVTTLPADEAGLLTEDTLMVSALVTCTSRGLADEMDFFATRIPEMPRNPAWGLATLDNVLMQTVRSRELARLAPSISDSLAREADSYLTGIALDSLVTDSVLSAVTVTEDDLLEEYALLDTVFQVPEMRVLLALYLPPGEEDTFLEALDAGRGEDFVEGLGGLPFLFREAPVSRITGPLVPTDVPEEHRDAVFGVQPGDTTLLGPFPIGRMPGMALYRVLEVIPEHEADWTEIRPMLRQSALARLQAAGLEEWLDRLGRLHGYRTNPDAIRALPRDPGLWGPAP